MGYSLYDKIHHNLQASIFNGHQRQRQTAIIAAEYCSSISRNLDSVQILHLAVELSYSTLPLICVTF
tara:strand:- start:16057 stop:16257 length:201 start_codon:yes stop_codon:yes gene_type:complete